MKPTSFLAILLTLATTGCATNYLKTKTPAQAQTNLSSFIAGGGLSTSSKGDCILTINYKNGKTTPIKLNSSICVDAKNAIVAIALKPAPPVPAADVAPTANQPKPTELPKTVEPAK